MERSVADAAAPAGGLFFFGGTFDPPHHGHLAIVKYILKTNAAARIVVMPAAGAPLRVDERLFSYRERFRLLRLLLQSEIVAGQVALSKLERSLPRPNYTADTLAALAKHCATPPVIVIGADQAEKLPLWHRSEELMARYKFLVFARPGSPAKNNPQLNARFIGDFAENISATEIREKLAALPAAKRFAAALALYPNQ